MTIEQIFESLASVRWDVAHRTYGSSHSTLIGLMVEWWINRSQSHTVFDGAPSFGSAGQADALLCTDGSPVGVLEVEGTQALAKVQTISRYFSSGRPELASIRFGILLAYSYEPKGRGLAKAYPPAEVAEVTDAMKAVTKQHAPRSFVFLGLDKRLDQFDGLRSGAYTAGTTEKVAGMLFQDGVETKRATFFDAASIG